MKNSLRLHSYLKIAIIRFLKNISLLIATACLTVTIILVAQPKAKPCVEKPASSGASYDKKAGPEQAKKNSILRRFISYNESQTSFKF